MTHVTATAFGADFLPFIGGCSCGWVGGHRQTLQAAVADTIEHKRSSAWNMTLPAGFVDWPGQLQED